MIRTCRNCGGLYSDSPPEAFAGKPCNCDSVEQVNPRIAQLERELNGFKETIQTQREQIEDLKRERDEVRALFKLSHTLEKNQRNKLAQQPQKAKAFDYLEALSWDEKMDFLMSMTDSETLISAIQNAQKDTP